MKLLGVNLTFKEIIESDVICKVDKIVALDKGRISTNIHEPNALTFFVVDILKNRHGMIGTILCDGQKFAEVSDFPYAHWHYLSKMDERIRHGVELAIAEYIDP